MIKSFNGIEIAYKTDMNGTKTDKSAYRLISFRPGEELGDKFERIKEALNSTDGELARRAFLEGLDIAARKMAEEKRKEATALLERLTPRKGSPLPFNNPLAPFVNNALTDTLHAALLTPVKTDGVVAQLVEHHNGIVPFAERETLPEGNAQGGSKHEPIMSVLSLQKPQSTIRAEGARSRR